MLPRNGKPHWLKTVCTGYIVHTRPFTDGVGDQWYAPTVSRLHMNLYAAGWGHPALRLYVIERQILF